MQKLTNKLLNQFVLVCAKNKSRISWQISAFFILLFSLLFISAELFVSLGFKDVSLAETIIFVSVCIGVIIYVLYAFNSYINKKLEKDETLKERVIKEQESEERIRKIQRENRKRYPRTSIVDYIYLIIGIPLTLFIIIGIIGLVFFGWRQLF